MTRYRYRAARPDGGIVRGVIDAPDGSAAVRTLTDRRLLVVDVREDRWTRSARPLPRRACAVFLRGLAALLDAGIPLDRGLGTVRAGPRLERAIAEIRRRVREGASLATALAAEPGMPPLAVALVRAGERSGLGAACHRAADQLEREADLAHRVRAALTYPTLLVLVGGAAVAVLVTVVLPRFVALLGDLGAALPWTTGTLLAVSAFLTDAWLPVAVIAVLGLGALGAWVRSPAGHRLLLAVPLLGATRFQFASARVARGLAALLATGTPVLAALRAAGAAAGDHAVRGRLEAAAEQVRRGGTLGEALAATRAVDPQLVDLLAAGERSGRLAALLAHGADLAEAEATRRLDAAVRLIEPGLIILIGAAVAFVALALLQAVYGLRVT